MTIEHVVVCGDGQRSANHIKVVVNCVTVRCVKRADSKQRRISSEIIKMLFNWLGDPANERPGILFQSLIRIMVSHSGKMHNVVVDWLVGASLEEEGTVPPRYV